MAQRTKQALADAFLTLLSKKTLDKITISDIVEASGYNRQTFYYHFHDVYDMMEWIFTMKTQRALELPLTPANWEISLAALTNRMLENRRLILNAYASISRDQLDRYLYSAVYRIMLDVVKNVADGYGLTVPEDDLRFIATAYKHVLIGFMMEWIQGGMNTDPTLICDKMNRTFSGSLHDVLSRCAVKETKQPAVPRFVEKCDNRADLPKT